MATLQILEATGISAKQLHELNVQLAEVMEWLCLRAPNAKYSIGFAFELAVHGFGRGYNLHAILDEIAILEGTWSKRSVTKPAKRFRKPPLKNIWHKHHNQAYFLWENICLELDRAGVMEAIFHPYLGKLVDDVVNEFVTDMIDGSYQNRADRSALTGEFIVFEKLVDGRNYYLTLGSHGEYEKISARISEYKQLDLDNGNF